MCVECLIGNLLDFRSGASQGGGVPSEAVLTVALQLMVQLWLDFTLYIDARAEVGKEILALLRYACVQIFFDF